MSRLILISCMALMLNACSYAISRSVAVKADTSIPFEKLVGAPDDYKGKVLILGGTIVRAAQAGQGILLEVIQKELDYWGRPRRTYKTGGRFLVLIRTASEAYAPGQEIAVAGEVIGSGKGIDGSGPHPMLRPLEIRIWQVERASDRPAWLDPLYDPAGSGRPAW